MALSAPNQFGPAGSPAEGGEDKRSIAMRRLLEAKRLHTPPAGQSAAAGAGRFRLDAPLHALVWQGMAMFLLGLLVGIGLHVLVTVAAG